VGRRVIAVASPFFVGTRRAAPGVLTAPFGAANTK